MSGEAGGLILIPLALAAMPLVLGGLAIAGIVTVGVKAGGAAVLHDVYHGNAGQAVDVVVVVEDGVGVFVDEDVAISDGGSDVPYFVEDAGGVLAADFLFGVAWLLGPHHVEQDAVGGGVERHMGVLAPVLRAFAPAVVLVFVGPLGHALVFNVEEDDVNGD